MSRIEIVDSGYVHKPNENVLSYAAWPSIARAADGAILVAYSGHRMDHVDPFGMECIRRSYDEGKTWTNPIMVYDSPLDDRDPALATLPGKDVAISFGTLPRNLYTECPESPFYAKPWEKGMHELCRQLGLAYIRMVAEDADERYAGSWMTISHDDGFTWEPPFRIPWGTPGGFRTLSDGSYLVVCRNDKHPAGVAWRSQDAVHWETLGSIPDYPENKQWDSWEHEIAELPDGRILCMIRMEEICEKGYSDTLTLASCFSGDKGKTWSVPKIIGNHGAPAGLLVHSSGKIICTYSYREAPPYGIWAMVSNDLGESWEKDLVLFTPKKDTLPGLYRYPDLGYARSIELENHDIFSIFYVKDFNSVRCAIRYIRWRLCE